MKKIALFLLLLSVPFAGVFGQETLHKSAIDTLVTPTLLLGQGRYSQAAESFHGQTMVLLTLERQLGAKEMWQVAGLAEGLAAIAAEKSNNPIAYEYWSNSVRYFLMSGSSWSELQSQLHQEFEQSTTRLQVNMAPGDTGVTIDNTWLQLLSLVEVWQEKLSYFSYRAPSSGLAQQATQQSQQTRTGNNDANGSQLRQYSPKKQLQLNDAFKGKQVFKPDVNSKLTDTQPSKASPQQTAPIVTNRIPNDLSNNKLPSKAKLNPTTIVTPIMVDGEIIERDHGTTANFNGERQMAVKPSSLNPASGPNAQPQPVQLTTEQQSGEKLISRGNLGAESSKGVEATQRRSFAPTQD